MAKDTCSIEGCDKVPHCRGWCPAHYARWLRNGEPGAAGDARRHPAVVCAADGCEKTARKRGLCENHYRRFMRNGHFDYVHKYGVYRNFTTNGYVRVWCPDHPCSIDGYALEHRKVWHDERGPIPAGMQIHHVNGDKTDNRIENLAMHSASEHTLRHHAESGVIHNQYGVWPIHKTTGGG